MTELFRGYVPTKNKKCQRKFKDKPLMTLEEVKSLPEYAGILSEDAILIDIDDHDQSEILMKIVEDMGIDCRVYQTTRGKHFLFRNDNSIKQCFTGTKLVCGLTADIKVGIKNSYSILKYDNKERFIEWDSQDWGHDYQTIPKFLLPVKKCEIDLLNLDDGDGRNSVLFEYILKLNSMGFSKDETRETLNLINKYIFKTPLSESEMETLSRDEAFPADTFMGKSGFLHDAFAQYLINEKHIVRINGQLHIYKDGVYVTGLREIESSMVSYLPKLKANQRAEVIKYIELVAKEIPVADARWIAFKNGLLNIETGALEGFSPDKAITNQIPWNYRPEAFSEVADKVLDKMACNDPQIRSLLEECIGYCFYRRNEMSKAFILTGEKSNGKSTYLEMVKSVLGEGNVSNLDLAELDERFSVAEMSGKLANIGDDISDEFMQGRSIATFKKIVSGNSVKAEYKGQDVFFFSPYVKLLFSANNIPRTKDKTGAVLRRLVIIPFNAVFSETDEDYDPYIIHKLKEEQVMEYLVRLGVEGLKRVVEQRKFSYSEKVSEAVKEYETENNPVLMFLDDVGMVEIENHTTDEVYSRYRVFCVENGYSEMTKTTFSKELNRRMGLVSKLKKVDGKVFRIYQKEVTVG